MSHTTLLHCYFVNCAGLQEEAEMRKKSELIRQIYAMEKVPIIRTNFLDLTETSGMGFLSEMSIAEVHTCVCVYACAC